MDFAEKRIKTREIDTGTKNKLAAAELAALSIAICTLYVAFELVMRFYPEGEARVWVFGATFVSVVGLLLFVNYLVDKGLAGWVSVERTEYYEELSTEGANQRLGKILSLVELQNSKEARWRTIDALKALATEAGDMNLAKACQRKMETEF